MPVWLVWDEYTQKFQEVTVLVIFIKNWEFFMYWDLGGPKKRFLSKNFQLGLHKIFTSL